MQLDGVTSWFSGNQIASTLVLVASFFVLRKLAEKLLRGSADFIPDDRRRLISLSRNTLDARSCQILPNKLICPHEHDEHFLARQSEILRG